MVQYLHKLDTFSITRGIQLSLAMTLKLNYGFQVAGSCFGAHIW